MVFRVASHSYRVSPGVCDSRITVPLCYVTSSHLSRTLWTKGSSTRLGKIVITEGGALRVGGISDFRKGELEQRVFFAGDDDFFVVSGCFGSPRDPSS